MMKPRYLLVTVIFLTGSCAEMNSFGASTEDSLVVRIGVDQNYCYGTPYIEVIYPQIVDGSEHKGTLLRIEEGESIVFETELARFASLGGSYVCLDEKYLIGTQIAISYGEVTCQGPRYVFSVNDLQPLLTREAIPLTQLNSVPSCE